MKLKQRGISLISLLFVGIVLAFAGVVGAQVAPTLVEYQAITKAVKKAANESSTVAEVRTSFEKSQNIENFSSLGPKDLEVTKNGDKVVVNFAYNKEIHLGGPAYLLLKYSGTTAK
jgi:Domain of unknown function (DUF4845)